MLFLLAFGFGLGCLALFLVLVGVMIVVFALAFAYALWYGWQKMFGAEIAYPDLERVLIVDSLGGGGKSTLARKIAEQYDLQHICLDDLKYGPGWTRFSADEFERRLKIALDESQGRYVIEGLYFDPKLPNQKETFDRLWAESQLIVWLDVPRPVAVFRKLWRAVKRRFNLEPLGAAKETGAHLWAMTKHTWREYSLRRRILLGQWQLETGDRQLKVNWPCCADVV